MWSALVDALRATIFAGSHILNGSLGSSIIVVTALIRLALIPLAIRAARHARVQQARLAELQPRLSRLQKRLAGQPLRLAEETRMLHRKHGIRMIGPASLASAVLQVPLFGGLFSALRMGMKGRFLWVADVGRGDMLMTAVAAALAGLAATAGASTTQGPAGARLVPLIIVGATLAFLWSASSAVAGR
jgi:YidC/Oxa1 family membrane protein insertase